MGIKEAHTEYLLWVGEESLVFLNDAVEGPRMSAQDFVILLVRLHEVLAGRK